MSIEKGQTLSLKHIQILQPGDTIRSLKDNGNYYKKDKEYVITKIGPGNPDVDPDQRTDIMYAHIITDKGVEFGLRNWITHFSYVGLKLSKDELFLEGLFN